MRTITVVPYNPLWAVEFSKLRTIYAHALAGQTFRIEHVGSTSVPGLWAKPILDIDIVCMSEDDKPLIIEKLSSLGYEHQGDLGIPGREAFKRSSDEVPFGGRGDWLEHHLYLVCEGCEALENHLKLREHLRSHPEAVEAYSCLKQELARRFPHDIDSYVEGKTQLIVSMLKSKGMNNEVLERIVNDNRKGADV